MPGNPVSLVLLKCKATRVSYPLPVCWVFQILSGLHVKFRAEFLGAWTWYSRGSRAYCDVCEHRTGCLRPLSLNGSVKAKQAQILKDRFQKAILVRRTKFQHLKTFGVLSRDDLWIALPRSRSYSYRWSSLWSGVGWATEEVKITSSYPYYLVFVLHFISNVFGELQKANQTC